MNSMLRLERNDTNQTVALQRPLYLIAILMLGWSSVVAPVTSAVRLASTCSLPQLQVECDKLSSLPLTGYLSFYDITYAAQDFGMLISLPPAAVLYPGSVSDIASVVAAVYASDLNVTIAPRGPGHSTNGQSQALHGIVIEMSTIRGIHVNVPEMFVEASAGELWVDVLRASLLKGLSPKSFTDYLHLSVGGTLSNAGISGQAYRWGPQINNVLQLEIISGAGDFVICSKDKHSDLFFAALGGLGQFGIITKARIRLQVAEPNVRWIRAIYTDFISFKRDQELLIAEANSSDAFDYVEGFVVANTANPQFGYSSVPFPGTGQIVDQRLMPDPASERVLYYIELAKNYNNKTEPVHLMDTKMREKLGHLSYVSTQIFSVDVSYFDFLERVYVTELVLRSVGQWEVPHPWINMFVPASKIAEFDHIVFKTLTADSMNGPIIIYPLNRNKWDYRMSAQVPKEDVFYLVAFLQSVLPSMGPSLTTLMSRNNNILEYCQQLGCKEYLPRYDALSDWQAHYGDNWSTFVRNKMRFDWKAIFSPGQNIFVRGQILDLLK